MDISNHIENLIKLGMLIDYIGCEDKLERRLKKINLTDKDIKLVKKFAEDLIIDRYVDDFEKLYEFIVSNYDEMKELNLSIAEEFFYAESEAVIKYEMDSKKREEKGK